MGKIKPTNDSEPLFSNAIHTKKDWKRIKKVLPKLIKKLNPTPMRG